MLHCVVFSLFRMDGMASRALDAVATKDITIMPERFEKVRCSS
jgi:hypothetical protein